MQPVEVQDAEDRFYELIAQVEAGAEIVVSRSGAPVAKIVPIREMPPPRQPGPLED